MPDGTIFGIGEAGREHYAAAPQEEKEIWKEAGKAAGVTIFRKKLIFSGSIFQNCRPNFPFFMIYQGFPL